MEETCPRELTWAGLTSALAVELRVIHGFRRPEVPPPPARVAFPHGGKGWRMLSVTGGIVFSAKLLTVAELVRVGFHIGNYSTWLLHVYVSREQIPSSCRGGA